MSWFINALQNELDKFNHTIITIAAGNRGVPDDLQKCHAMSKQLQQNQTDINQRLTVYDGRIANLTLQAANLGMRLSLVEKKINEYPNLLSNPDATKDPSVKVLSSEVAKLGSNYQALNDRVKSLKDTTSSLQLYHTKLKENITAISEKLNNVGSVKTDETMINNVSEKLHELIENTSTNVSAINRTLTSRIDWLTGDQKSNREVIEKLREDNQKLIAQVKTIESECKTTDNKVTKSFAEMDSKITSLRTQIDKVATNVTNLHAQPNSNDSFESSGQLKGEKNGTQTKS
jgi:chromosome segregation ATPase